MKTAEWRYRGVMRGQSGAKQSGGSQKTMFKLAFILRRQHAWVGNRHTASVSNIPLYLLVGESTFFARAVSRLCRCFAKPIA